MTQNQISSLEGMVAWIRELIADPNLDISFTNTVKDQMHEIQIDLMDIIFILGRCTEIAQDYPSGCYTVRGATTDSIRVAIVVAPRSEKNRIKIVKVWREKGSN